MAQVLEVMTAIERESEFDIVFVDTEFSRLRFEKENIRDWAKSTATLSVGMVPLADGLPFYAVQKITKRLRKQCSHFVIAEVLPHIEAAEVTCRFTTAMQFKRAFTAYLAKRKAATGLPPLFAVDWIGDAFLLEYMLPMDADILLLDELSAVTRCMERFFIGDLRRHNALHDAMALRQGFIDHKSESTREGA